MGMDAGWRLEGRGKGHVLTRRPRFRLKIGRSKVNCWVWMPEGVMERVGIVEGVALDKCVSGWISGESMGGFLVLVGG